MDILINTSHTYQTMERFGMSGAWWAQSVGKWTNTEPDGAPVRDRISELLYSKEKGIGLGIFRYNLGSGSAESGKGDYGDPLRRAESFYTPAGLDFTKDAAAVYMMRRAVADGAEEVIFFVNSPIEQLTINGLGHTQKRRTGRTNIKKENIPAFADYVLNAVEHFLGEGVPIKYISPVNEPLWVWNGGQEGCHYSPRQAACVMRVFAEKMKTRPALAGVKLSGMENGDIRWFNKSYTRALLNNRAARPLVDGVDVHSYFLNDRLPFLGNRPAWLRRYRQWMDKRYPGVPVRVSEWCHMRGGRDAGMDSALEQAKVMLEDITILNAASFQGWIACSPYDYCDGLIYIDEKTETYTLTKRYFAFGNFSKFIPAGAVRAAAKTDDPDVTAAAFIKDDTAVFVLLNTDCAAKTLRLKFPCEAYVTSETQNLERRAFKVGEAIPLPARSVSTVVAPRAGRIVV